ncbi:MAG: serine/threonine-protein phosphatase [Acidobacteria bacterium]|nr:serine/threonine-protein phosphatase [Acidobacteriota bacterium]
MLDLEFAERSDTGRVRTNNEDALGHVLPLNAAQVQSQGWFFATADGMGGHDAGEVASNLAIITALEGFRKIPKGVMHVSLLPRLLQEANAAVYEAGHATAPHRARMGTTFVACALRFDSAVVSHVGDSRCYLLRNGRCTQLTRDHTMADEHVKLGILSRQDAATDNGRHILTRSLGSDMFVAADTLTVNIIPGDILVLCTDGLHGAVSDLAMQQIIQQHPNLEQAAQALVDAANNAGGNDNISVQLIRIRSVERMGLYRGRPYRLL